MRTKNGSGVAVQNSMRNATPSKTFKNSNKDDIISVVTRDNIRKLKAHMGGAEGNSTGPGGSVVLNPKDFSRIMKEATVLSPEDLQRQAIQLASERTKAAEASRRRKIEMENMEHKRTANAKLSEVEQEAKAKNDYLLSKAKLQLEEEEDEIKHMNELMLYAKCVAIRDVQVDEKKMIEAAVKNEEFRLDAMMEAERVQQLKRTEELREARIAELRRGASVIRKQIEENREAALLEQERKDQETKLILKKIKDIQLQDTQEKQVKIAAQKKLMEEVTKANAESMERKKYQKVLDMEEEKKVLQYILDKEKRDLEADRNAQERKAEREKELSRLRAAQEKVTDKQAQQDALRAKRASEAYEREWRRKEKGAAEKNAAQEAALREERSRQQLEREMALAAEAHQMKKEFYENIERQKKEERRIKEEEGKKVEKNKANSVEVKKQILHKEEIRRKERTDFFMEGIQLSAERLETKKRLNAIKDRKLSELRGLGVPEKYCNEIARKMANEKETFSKMKV